MSNQIPAGQSPIYLEVLLEEYKSVRQAAVAIHGRIDAILTIMLTVFAGIVAFLATSSTAGAHHLFLVASMIYSAFGLLLSFALKQIYLLATYEEEILRPRIERFLQTQLGDPSIAALEWLSFQRHVLTGGWLALAMNAIQGAGHVLLPVGISIGFIIVFVLLKTSVNAAWTSTEVILLIISLTLMSMMLLSFVLTTTAYWLKPLKPDSGRTATEQVSTKKESA